MSNSPEDPEEAEKPTDAFARAIARSRLKELVGNVGYARNEPPPIPKEGEKPKGVISRAPKQKSPKSSTLGVIHGHAKLKAYPVTKNELFTLGALGFAASLFFSVGAGAIGYSMDIFKDLELTSNLGPELVARWNTIEHFAYYGGIGVLIVGTVLVGLGAINIMSIIRRTKFGDE